MHFTYCDKHDTSLRQGDIIKKDDNVISALRTIHPHYLKEDYTHFIILTQSCDLALRSGRCSSRYISLAAIRPLSIALEREISKYQLDSFSKLANICADENRGYLNDFLRKLFNNNCPEYFYLESQPEFGLPENSCAFLRLSIAIKAEVHYAMCHNARILSLNENFRAKLGWLVGNIYSRVGTEDWSPNNLSEEDFTSKVKKELDEFCKWVPKRHLDHAKKQAKKREKEDKGFVLTKDIANQILDETVVLSKKDQIVRRSLEVLEQNRLVQDEETKRQIYNILLSDPEISLLIK